MVQLGGQTALGLAKGLKSYGIPILGTTPESIDQAEERGQFQQILDAAGLRSPANGMATNLAEAVAVANRIGYPVLVRPSFVLGGRGMEIVYDEKTLIGYFDRIANHALVDSEHPLLVDRFLDDAIEIDIDAIFDGEQLFVGGVMEHIEEAGIHSGDSSCTLPPITLSETQIDRVAKATEEIGHNIGAIQLDVKDAVRSISQISNIISKINDISALIAGAVEEQAATAGEIGRNISSASDGSNSIAANISSVAVASKNTSEGASNTQIAAVQLSKIAEELSLLVSEFNIS
jgi:carbamoylphosphate synthase large subunit